MSIAKPVPLLALVLILLAAAAANAQMPYGPPITLEQAKKVARAFCKAKLQLF